MDFLKVAKIESCQSWKWVPHFLLSCQIAKLPNCQIAKLQVAKLWTCDHGAKSLSFLVKPFPTYWNIIFFLENTAIQKAFSFLLFIGNIADQCSPKTVYYSIAYAGGWLHFC